MKLMTDYVIFSNRGDPDFTQKEDLTVERLSLLDPKYVFFPFWSWMIPRKIWRNFECIAFHSTNLPYGRGGSPIQNLIIRGHKKTKISAFRVNEVLDGGDIYCKWDLDLSGSAGEIYERAYRIITEDMIPYICKYNPTPVPQSGEVVEFDRLQDNSHLSNATSVRDHIRMLDASGIQPAYIDIDGTRIEFFNATAEGAEVRFVNV